MTKLNLDRDFYAIIGEFKDCHAFLETDAGIDSVDQVIAELKEYDNAHTVFWLNPHEGHASDVTEDIARSWFEGLEMWFTNGEPDPAILQFIVDNLPEFDTLLAEMRSAA